MCLALVAFDVHPRFCVVIAANRDEFHARAAAPAAWWEDGILAGKDLEAGGTWLGIDRRGRFALLTNVREPARHDPAAPSRGALVPRFINDGAPPIRALAGLVDAGARHNGFNLLAGNAHELGWASNRAPSIARLPAGVYGLSNDLLDTPWPKVLRAKAGLERWCRAARGNAGDDADLAPLFVLLHDTERAPDAALPATGISLDWERVLSSPFIIGDGYGTRCSTIVTIGRDGSVQFVERSFDAAGNATFDRDYRFDIEA